jgi:hypothetical protein
MATDKNTIGVTEANDKFLEALTQSGLFSDQMEAAKLGIALAIRNAVAPGEASGVDTKWNVGSFDRDGHVRSVLNVLYPEIATPYRLAEHFINEGLGLLRPLVEADPNLDILKLQESLGAPTAVGRVCAPPG